MATNHDTTDDDSHWHPATVRRRLKTEAELTDAQTEGLVTAIRNPEAAVKTVGEYADFDANSLKNAIWRIKMGGFEDTHDHIPALTEGSKKFTDRTLKQRAGIHWHAIHPNGMDALTYKQAAEHCSAETGVPIHWSSLYSVEKDYPDLIAKRRERLPDDEITRLTEADAPDSLTRDSGTDTPIRALLEEAGITDLPGHNLDPVPTLEQAQVAGRENGLKTISEMRENGELENLGGRPPEGDSGGGFERYDPEGEHPEDGAADPESGENAESGETTQRRVGNAGYSGPVTGLDATGGRAPSLLVERTTGEADDPVTEELQRIRDEDGEFGETAYERPVEIDDRDALESEIRRLRMLVASQGSMLKALRETLDNLSVSVEVNAEPPEVDGDE